MTVNLFHGLQFEMRKAKKLSKNVATWICLFTSIY